jgi:predicted DNA-binding mobile mystery protein A
MLNMPCFTLTLSTVCHALPCMPIDLRPSLLKALDSAIQPMQAAQRAVIRPSRGWLKAIRESLGLSHAAVANKIGISRQAYFEIEQREDSEKISIQNLGRAAAALKCDLVYFLVPQAQDTETFAALAAKEDSKTRNLEAAEHSMVLEGQGSLRKTDDKNIGLAKMIFWLRQNLELYELISVNVGNLRTVGASEALFGHLQKLAMEAIAVTICKIYEEEKRNELNSIVGVINALPERNQYTQAQLRSVERFAEKQGMRKECENPREYLLQLFSEFTISHAEGFSSLRRFRDKFASHSEHNFELGTLPSFEEFEALYTFADGFYRLISEEFLDVGPALFELYVRTGFIKLLRAIGIKNPAQRFPA